MAVTATVTAKTGVAQTVTAQALTGVTEMKFAFGSPSNPIKQNVLFVQCDQGNLQFDINATTTVTCTITAGGNAAWVVSQ